MYKYSAFRINYKSFRSSMSKNFTVIPGSFAVIPGPDRGSHPSVMADLIGHLHRHPRLDRGSHSEQERHHPLPALNYYIALFWINITVCITNLYDTTVAVTDPYATERAYAMRLILVVFINMRPIS